MMIEVGGKLKTGLLVASVVLLGVAAFSARTEDVVKIKGEACEKFVAGQSKSSIRVRVTDKASYKAVSQIENLADVRSHMLEHDFNVIVYNLVDNYMRDLMVRTTSQNDEELCVKVTGAIPVTDIESVIRNYSPDSPAPEYDIKQAAEIEEEVITDEDEWAMYPQAEPAADVLYNGTDEITEQEKQFADVNNENFDKINVYNQETLNDSPQYPVVYAENNEKNLIEKKQLQNINDKTSSFTENQTEDENKYLEAENNISKTQDISKSQENLSETEQNKVFVYVGPVEFNNNTYSTKSSQVLKDMFADTQGYQLVNNSDQANYAFYPKVLKAKVDILNSQTKRMQMVVSLELKKSDSSISFSEHQNRFVLFESGKNEQEIAQQLLHKLLRKAGRKLFLRIDQSQENNMTQYQSND